MSIAPAGPPPPLILIVDDNSVMRVVVGHMLKRAGFAIAGVASGTEALALLTRVSIALVLSDIEMPQMDGFALVAAMRTQGLNVPVVLCSGLCPEHVRAMTSGNRLVRAVLTKPVASADLTMVIHQVLAGS